MEDGECLISRQFYGEKNHSSTSNLVEKRVRMMRENPISLPESPNLLGDPQVWRTFCRQSLALDFAEKIGMGVMAFAFEGNTTGVGGRRRFLVCHPKILWRAVKDRPLSSRCIYEVILESHVCKLYFDLEFSRGLNLKVDGARATKAFITIVNHYLLKEFGVNCRAEDVLDLDSSTDVKFSRHLIYNAAEVAFADNSHAGRFVKMICNDLRTAVKEVNFTIPNVSKDDIEALFVNTYSSRVIFCDEGVYSKNRNFRTYKSTKYGKQTPLLISSQNQYVPSLCPDEQQYFLDSLVTFVPSSTKILRYGAQIDSFGVTERGKRAAVSECLPQTSTLSPYVEIEYYLQDFLGGENLIRKWHYFSQSELLVFEIDKRHRFCANIGREHKSNSVMYVANLKKGVFYQKCYDPHCHGYKSNEMLLPPETMPWKLDSEPFDNVDGGEDESLLMEIADRVEKEELNKSQRGEKDFPKGLGLDIQGNKFDSEKQTLSEVTRTWGQNQSGNSQDYNLCHSVLPYPWDQLSQVESSTSQKPICQTVDEKNTDRSSDPSTGKYSEVEWASAISDQEMLRLALN